MANISGSTHNITALTKRDYLAYSIGEAIHTYYLPVILVLGFIGNFFSLVVTLQRQNRSISCCIYMTGLALSDTMMLVIGSVYWVSTILVAGSRANEHNCKVFTLVYQTIATYSIYLIVLMTVDRCLAVKLPYTSKSWRTAKAARIATVVLAAVVILVNLPYYYLAGYNTERHCVSLKTANTSTKLYAWFYLFLLSFVPCLGILVMNTIIIVSLKRRKGFWKRSTRSINTMGTFSKHSDNESHSQSESEAERDRHRGKTTHKVSRTRERQLTFMLLFVSFALLLLTEPQYIRRLVYLVPGSDTSHQVAPPYKEAMFHLVHSITNKLFYTNNAINFYVYILTSNKFRSDFCKPFQCG